jgi:alpha-tubulin suppressor-like RCC1 family protein
MCNFTRDAGNQFELKACTGHASVAKGEIMPVTRQGNRVVIKSVMRGLKCWLLMLVIGMVWLPTGNAATHSVASSVAAGEYHTCALTSDGVVQCWGDNGEGQLGNNDLNESITPVTVSGQTGGIISITAGSHHNCALSNIGRVSCWGGNTFGQLGNGTQTASGVPVDVPAISGGIVGIAAGGAHTCALSDVGDVWCWGDNSLGQLGDGTTTQTSIPVKVIGFTERVVSISAGVQHACALTTSGSVLCWGGNSSGQLGNGTQSQSSMPVAVSELTNVISAIAAGGQHTCALTADGGVKCWGDNSFGQLGNGSGAADVISTTPVDVTGLAKGVVSIAASSQTCAVKLEGTVLCWGDNASGQLGEGTTTPSTLPVPVQGLTEGISTLATGYFHTCAMTTAGSLQCVGDNSFGQLGDGTVAATTLPASVAGYDVMGQSSNVITVTAPAGLPASVMTANAGTSLSLAATVQSGQPAIYTSLTPNRCSVVVSTLSLVSEGLCLIETSSPASGNFNAAPAMLSEVDVMPAATTSTAPVQKPTLKAKASLLAASSLSITFGTLSDRTYGDAPFTISATGPSNGAGVYFYSATPYVCGTSGITGVSYVGGGAYADTVTVSLYSGGTCTIVAYVPAPGSTVGNVPDPTIPTVTQSFNVVPAIQTLTFAPTPTVAFDALNGFYTAGTVSATSSLSNLQYLPATITSLTPAICSISYSNLTGWAYVLVPLAGGTCTIAANQAGNASVAPAPQVTRDIIIPFVSQSIGVSSSLSSVTPLPNRTYGDLAFIYGWATSGLAVTFSSTTSSVCSLTVIQTGSTYLRSISRIDLTGSGTCTIIASQVGSAVYSAATPITQSFNVAKVSQSLTFSPAPTVGAHTASGYPTVTVSATSSYGTSLLATYSSLTPAICTISAQANNVVVPLLPGTCTIAANQAGNATAAAAPQVTQDIIVPYASQQITMGNPPSPYVGISGTLIVLGAGASGNPVIFSSLTTSICTVSGTTVTAISAGNCSVTANQAGNAYYSAAQQLNLVIVIYQGYQYITWGTAPTVVVGGTGTLSATGGASGNPVTFTSNTPATCTVSGSTVTGVKAGTCSILASQAGNANYLASESFLATRSFNIGQGSQVISFGTAPTVLMGVIGTVNATGGASGNPVTFTSITPTTCTVSGSTVTGVTAETCTIAANQVGNANYSAAIQATQTFSIGQGSQSIIFGSAPNLVFGGTGTVSATGGASGNPITFSSLTSSVCTVSGTTVTGVTAGICTLTADQAGNLNYTAANKVTQTFSIGQANQTLTFGTAPVVAVGGTGMVSATGGASGNPVTFSSTTTGGCTVNGNTVTGVTVGTCTIAANQAGNTNFSAAPQVTQTIAIGMGTQTITFIAVPPVTVGGYAMLNAGASSGLMVTYTSLTPTVCSAGINTISAISVGACIIQASQAGSANYSGATPVTQTITVNGINQTISFAAAPAVMVGGTSTLSATASSGLAVTYSSTTPSLCTVSGSTVTGIAVGNCVVAANQAGNATYSAAPQATQTLAIVQGNQNISFGSASTVVVGGTGTVSATGGASGNPVAFSSLTTGVCTVSGNTVTGVTAGTCTIAADQAGNANYNAATQATQIFSVGQASQSITLGAAPNQLVFGGTGTLSATASSGLPVTFNSLTTSVCTVSSNTVSAIAVGTCTITVDQSGNANYSAAPQVQQSFKVGLAVQTITFTSPIPTGATVGGSTYTPTATATSGLPVVLSVSSSTTAFCAISNGVVSFTGAGAGACSIIANQAGNANYSPATQATQTFTIARGNQTITFGTAPTVIVGGTGTLSATASSGLPVAFGSTTPTNCTVSGRTVTGVTAGTCSIEASQAGNPNYNAATKATQIFSVGQASQSIAFSAAPTLVVGGTGTLSATASSGLAVTFSSLTPAICAVSGNTVKGIAAGSCMIAANQSGNATFSAATQVTQSLAVGPASQTIAFGTPPAIAVGGTGTLIATGGASGYLVTFSSLTGSICSITLTGGSVTGLAVGTCTIAANQQGDANYYAPPQTTLSFTITQGTQTITLGTAPTVVVGGTGTLSATSSVGLPVSFTSTTPATCAVSGSAITGVAVGSCVIAGNQAGNINYTAATQVTQTIIIGASVAAPSAPTNVAVQLTTTQPQAVVSWTDTSRNETSWLVQRSASGSSTWTTVQTFSRSTGATSGETVSSSPISVNWGTQYLFRVVARNAAGQGISATASLDMASPPAAPTAVAATATPRSTTDTVTVIWTSQSNNEIDFAVQRCRVTPTNPCTGNTGWNNVGTTAINATSWRQTGVWQKTTYAYRIQASNPNGNSAWVRSSNLVTP